MRTFLVVCVSLLVVCALAGCAAFSPPALELNISKELPEGQGNTDVQLVTRYELEQGGQLYLNKETGEWEINLNSATVNDTDTLMATLVNQMMQMMMFMATGMPPQGGNPPAPYNPPPQYPPTE